MVVASLNVKCMLLLSFLFPGKGELGLIVIDIADFKLPPLDRSLEVILLSEDVMCQS